jgi:hypothetical protein
MNSEDAMPAWLGLMSADDQPMVILITWTFVLALALILPGSAAAVVNTLSALVREMSGRLGRRSIG